MEPFPKRQRLFAHIEHDVPRNFYDQEAQFEETPDNGLDDFVVEGDEIEGEGAERGTPSFDDDSLFQQRRARLDDKLKSRFEAIFEKYGKDFEGVGDEIDMATGEVVVDNGHILKMQDEMDVGCSRRPQRVQSESTDEVNEGSIISLDNTDMENDDEEEGDEDGEDLETTSDDDMVADDVILRGFAQANRFLQNSSELDTIPNPTLRNYNYAEDPGPSQRVDLSSRSDILTRFGPRIGPQILSLISQQQVQDDSHIEPAWRVPIIPTSRPSKSSAVKTFPSLPEVERSPSPVASKSLWAPVTTRRRRRPVVEEDRTLFRGETVAQKYQKAADVGSRQRSPNFTNEEDEILFKGVTNGRHDGLTLTQISHTLEAKFPHRTSHSWRNRWIEKFSYVPKNEPIEISDDTSEASTDEDRNGRHMQHHRNYAQCVVAPAAGLERPTRARKPAPKDSRIISWQDAVGVIESLDRDEHAEVLEDARMTRRRTEQSELPLESRRWALQSGALNTTFRHQDRVEDSPAHIQPQTSINHISDSEEISIPGVPCPHAECKSRFKTKYKLQPRSDEDLSEMNLHLFNVHHTTPYPCSESNCKRSGENGYFMQADLVKHVSRAHPGATALHQLRGRVAPDLLNASALRNFSRGRTSIEAGNMPHIRRRDSDFMSPTKDFGSTMPLSTSILSSDFDPDTTLTPRAREQYGDTTVTPLTSISSLVVNHSAASEPIRQNRESQQRTFSDAQTNNGILTERRGHSYSRKLSVELQYFKVAEKHTSPKISSVEGLFEVAQREAFLPTPSTSSSHHPRTSSHTSKKTILTLHDDHQQVDKIRGAEIIKNSAPKDVGVDMDSLIPRSPSPPIVVDEILNSSCIAVIEPRPHSHTSSLRQQVPEVFTQDTQTQVYEFSDVEDNLEILTKSPIVTKSRPQNNSIILQQEPLQPLQRAEPVFGISAQVPDVDLAALRHGNSDQHSQPFSTPAILPQESSENPAQISTPSGPLKPKIFQALVPPQVPLRTPANIKPRKSILCQLLKSGDLDELSLGDDDLILISSCPRATPKLNPKIRIKQEDSTNTPMMSSSMTKKRTLSMFQDADEVDELCLTVEITPKVQPIHIKVEEEDAKSSSMQVVNVPDSSRHTKPSRLAKSLCNDEVTTNQNPSSDLTPIGRNKEKVQLLEIRDSVEASSPTTSSNSKRTNVPSSSSPLDELLTPTAKKRWTGDILKTNKTVISIRTPGGTVRRCGEDGFTCGRSFCFRCGVSATAASVT